MFPHAHVMSPACRSRSSVRERKESQDGRIGKIAAMGRSADLEAYLLNICGITTRTMIEACL
jgi:hypothetical protein